MDEFIKLGGYLVEGQPEVAHDNTLSGNGLEGSPLGLSEQVSEVNDLVHSNSGTWNGVSAKLDTTAFSDVSGTFLTAHQDLSDYQTIAGMTAYATTGDLTAYQTTAEMTAYQIAGDYYSASNPSGFISEVPAGTMNESAFEYNGSNKISAYNGSAFAAGDSADVVNMVINSAGDTADFVSGFNGTPIIANRLQTGTYQFNTNSRLEFTPTASMFPPAINSALTSLKWATGAGMMVSAGNFRGCYKANEVFLSRNSGNNNTHTIQLTCDPTDSYIYGRKNFSGGDYRLESRYVTGRTGNNTWKYGTAEDAALRAVSSCDMHESAFEYDANDKISGYNGSAFAGGSDVPEGVMVESGLEYNAVNEISAYNGSAIAQYGHEAQWLVHDDTLVHASNSAQYALGVNLSAVAHLLGGNDRTLLWSGESIDTLTLNESPLNFNTIEVLWQGGTETENYMQGSIEFIPGRNYLIIHSYFNGNVTGNNYHECFTKWSGVSGVNWTNYSNTMKNVLSNTWENDSNWTTLKRVYGIGRKA